MTKRTVPVHYLRPNETVWTPPAVICLDTETYNYQDGDNEVHTLRLWVARYTDRRPPKGCKAIDEWADGESGEELAFQVHAWMTKRRTVWLYAHNLHFDLSTSDLVDQLGLLDYNVTDFALDGSSPFVRLEHGEHRLTICDSFSWFQARLEDIGNAVDIDKPPLPAETDGWFEWMHRCETDVRILSEAMLTVMDWWDDNQLGRWSITGGASGWNALRHMPATQRILIDPDEAKMADDRQAIYGGRRGCWRVGNLPAGRFAELDLERAYTTVCAELPLPVERMAHFESLPVSHPWVTSGRHGILARVLISTDTPRWPCKVDNRVWYPVGTFWTVLAGPDIAEASRLGCLLQIGPGWMHKLGRALRPWALWCLDTQRNDNVMVPDVCKMVARNWGRSCVGKWAQRGFTRVQLGAAPTRGWDCMEGWNHSAGCRASIVDFGGWRWQISAAGETENAYPAILAWVEAHVRVALNRAIAVIGDSAMVCCDTDGMIVNTRILAARTRTMGPLEHGVRLAQGGPDHFIELANDATQPLKLREKRAYHNIMVIGPQHVQLDGKRRYSGVPAGAEPSRDGRLWARLWPKLAWQMRHGRAGTFLRPAQEYLITGTYAPGWVLADGRVVPVAVDARADGANHLVPWHFTAQGAAGSRLGPDQNRALKRYRYGPVAQRSAEDHSRRDEGRKPARGGRHARSP